MGGFPVNINKTQVIKDFFETYGHCAPETIVVGTDLNPANMNTGAGQFMGGRPISYKEMKYIKSITISSNKNIEININALYVSLNIGYGTYALPNFRGWCGPAHGPLTFEVGQWFDGSIISTLQLNVFSTTETVYTGHRLNATFNTITCYSDTNFYNDGLMLAVGDSIMVGNTGPTIKTNHLLWESKRLFETTGNRNLQIVNKAVSGSTSQFALYNLNNGAWRYPGVKVIVENHGTNDVSQNTTNAQFTTYMQTLIAWKQKFHPTAVLHCYGSTPLQNATNQARANELRNIKRDLVLAANDPLIRYLNFGDSFTPADNKYASSDGSGAGIHPNDSGSADVNAIQRANQSLYA